MFVLDTNICVALIRQRSEALLTRLRAQPIGGVAISSITLAELEYGVEKSTRPEQNRDALIAFLAPLEVLRFDEAAASRYGVLRADLERRGQPIGSLDLLIAAHALSLGVTLVTNNVREFRRVPGLMVEDWTA